MKGIHTRIFSAIIIACLLLTVLPATTMAYISLDFVDDSSARNGENWAWDLGTQTLTLSGANELGAITLPGGSKIFLSKGSVNTIVYGPSNGIYCMGDLEITGGGTLDISFEGVDTGVEELPDGISTDGLLTIFDCGEIMIRAARGIAVGNESTENLTIKNSGTLKIDAEVYGVRSTGSINITGCPNVEITAQNDCGMSAESGDITITNSNVHVNYGMVGIITGNKGAGGDIVITNSTVSTACGENGAAAIFAGDQAYPEDPAENHSRIVMNSCVINEPTGGRILNVDLDGRKCQSVTAMSGIEVITALEQFAKSVRIEPQVTSHDRPERFSVIYDMNGGTGTAPVDTQIYYANSVVKPLPGAGLSKDGYTFMGWQFADGTKVPDRFVMGDSNITLYAVWGVKIPATGDAYSMLGFALLILGLAIPTILLFRKRSLTT